MGITLDSKETVCGLDAKTARDLMVQFVNSAVSYGSDEICTNAIKFDVKRVFFKRGKDMGDKWLSTKEIDRKASEMSVNIINAMIAEGYLTNPEKKSLQGAPLYAITDKVKNLARHKFIKRLTRTDAEQKLQEFLARVSDWNSRDPGYWVQNVWLFGSMITDSPDVGDIDLVCEYCHNKDSANGLTEDEAFALFASGKCVTDEVKRFIKNRSKYLSMDGFNHSELSIIRGGYVQIVKDREVIRQRAG